MTAAPGEAAPYDMTPPSRSPIVSAAEKSATTSPAIPRPSASGDRITPPPRAARLPRAASRRRPGSPPGTSAERDDAIAQPDEPRAALVDPAAAVVGHENLDPGRRPPDLHLERRRVSMLDDVRDPFRAEEPDRRHDLGRAIELVHVHRGDKRGSSHDLVDRRTEPLLEGRHAQPSGERDEIGVSALDLCRRPCERDIEVGITARAR